MSAETVNVLLGTNVVVAFGLLFYFHAKVVFLIISDLVKSGRLKSGKLYTGIGDQDSPHARFVLFLSGELDPGLRRRWAWSILWLIVSLGVGIIFGELSRPKADDGG